MLNNQQIDSVEFEDLLNQVKFLKQQLSEANSELREISTRLEQTERELEQAQTELTEARIVIARARDIREWTKPSLITVLKLAKAACMNLERVANGWVLSMGSLTSRVYNRLKQVWLILTQDFYLHDILLRPDEGGKTPLPDAKPKVSKRNPCIAPANFKSKKDWELAPEENLLNTQTSYCFARSE